MSPLLLLQDSMKGSRFLIPALFKTIICPPAAIYLLSRLLKLELWTLIPLYILSFPALYIFRSELSLWRSSSLARSCGARPVPRVRGRWPLNIDVLRDWAKSGEEEAGYMIRQLEKHYGKTFNTRVLGEDQIITSDPKVMRRVMIGDFDNFVKGEKFRERAWDFLGDGIFSSDGERWKFHRNLLRPFFHSSHVNPSTFSPLITRFVKSLPTNQPFDIQRKLQRLATELAVFWMFGEEISPKEAEEVGDALSAAQKVVGRRVKIGTLWPLFELSRDPLILPMRTLLGFVRARTATAKLRCDKTSSNAGHLPERERNLLDQLLEATNDMKLVEDQLVNILMASRDTTSSLLTFCVYAICEYPDVAELLREEVLSVAGTSGPITKEMIRDSKYARCFINEVLRVYPTVPLNIRRSLKSSILPTSQGELLYMPPNTSVVLSTIVMQNSEAAWGPTAAEFDPDRWLTPRKNEENLMAWHLGPRMCMGRPFALTAVHTFLIILYRHLEDVSPQGVADTRHAVDPKIEAMDEDQLKRWKRKRIKADVVLAMQGGLNIEIAAA